MSMQEQIVVFGLNNQQYSLPIKSVSEIIRMKEITPVPNIEYYCKGIINLRGSVVPVISLNERLGMQGSEINDESRIIVVEKEDIKLGLIVDNVQSVTAYSPGDMETSDSLHSDNQFIKGIIHHGEDMILLLDLDMVISR